MLSRWPTDTPSTIKRGSVSHLPSELRDVMPTFLDAAGIDIPDLVDGQPLTCILQGSAFLPLPKGYYSLAHVPAGVALLGKSQ